MEEASTRRVCECGRRAVEKVAGPRSDNRGLRYLCCDKFVFFGKRKNYCRFFEWIDQPRVTKEQKREAQASKQQRKELSSHNTVLPTPIVRARGTLREFEKQCRTSEDLLFNKDEFGLEIGVSNDDLTIKQRSPAAYRFHSKGPAPVDRTTNEMSATMDYTATEQRSSIMDVLTPRSASKANDEMHAHMDSTLLKQQSPSTKFFREVTPTLVDMTSDAYIEAGHQECLLTNACQPETSNSKIIEVVQESQATCQCLQGDMLTPSTNPVNRLKDEVLSLDEGHVSLQATDIVEVPACLCMRVAILKTVKSKGPNQGLRFWVCSKSKPFYVKQKKSKEKDAEKGCKFFRWVDMPQEKSIAQKHEETQRRKELRKKKELSLLS